MPASAIRTTSARQRGPAAASPADAETAASRSVGRPRASIPCRPLAPAADGGRGTEREAQTDRDDARHGLPINLAAALQLAGVSPLDIAAATVQVQQGLAVLLQAKVLWVPNLNAGVDYSRHDGVQQNIFTGALFQKGRQSFFVGGGPSLNSSRSPTRSTSRWPRAGGRRARGQCPDRAERRTAGGQPSVLRPSRREGRLVGVEATIVRAQQLVDLAVGLAPL